MAYDYKIEDKQQYIRVEMSGERTPNNEIEDVVPIWANVTDLCHKKNINKVLGILNLTGDVPIVGSYYIVKLAESFGWGRNLRVALVEPHKEPDQTNAFTETVAVNRGYQLKVFGSEQDALAWLLDE
jgi:hypothetical protein